MVQGRRGAHQQAAPGFGGNFGGRACLATAAAHGERPEPGSAASSPDAAAAAEAAAPAASAGAAEPARSSAGGGGAAAGVGGGAAAEMAAPPPTDAVARQVEAQPSGGYLRGVLDPLDIEILAIALPML